MTSEVVKFTKLRTATDPSFWAKFAELKLDRYKLEDKSRIFLWASFSTANLNSRTNPTILDCTSFNESIETTSHNAAIPCPGYLVNTNTYESFRQTDLQQFIDSMGKQILEYIVDGTALREPWRLTHFIILSFADLKKYRFHYWAAYPTPFSLPEFYYSQKSVFAASAFAPEPLKKLQKSFDSLDGKGKSFFSVIVEDDDSLRLGDLKTGIDYINSSKESKNVYFAFYDPCQSSEPGWPLRNLLCLLFWHCREYTFEKVINILSVRGNDLQRAVLFTIKCKDYEDKEVTRQAIYDSRFVGWELNSNGKLGPNIADLSDHMDPVKLAERAVYFNLKLMKWRLVPELDLDKICNLRCLLLGAGTLGCSVARALIGWGVKNLTLVDNGVVSHSNTVRQSLYEHADAVERRPKSEAAARALLRICPMLNVEGLTFQIPMPGHVVGESLMKSTESAVEKLESLIKTHDVIFLLLDSREARWLPTLLSACYKKITINAALGFDSYTVQRHGTREDDDVLSPDLALRNPSGRDLGCYFCNDVTQPGNSQVDRTLDQQCTVSRPGLSQIAAGLAVELLVSLTQHPEGIEARAFMDDGREPCQSSERESCIGLLGGVPHTIRGSLWSHEMRMTITHRFASCTACSVPLIAEYRKRGLNFILDACNEPNYLEKLAGLEDLLKRPDLDELCYVLDSSSDDENEIPTPANS